MTDKAALLSMLDLLLFFHEPDERFEETYGHLEDPGAQFDADHTAAWEGAKEMVRVGRETPPSHDD